jgi:bifunctional UDP-N-acetylglucosamine pyrophosphorylase/glucosamine-1-phosphate N-acetyltransferase
VSFTAVVMAAGQGTRMRSEIPKGLHPVCGRPMVHWPVLAAQEAGADKVVVVAGPDGALEGKLPDGVVLAVQPVADGTGGAVLAAADELRGAPAVVVINGDVPLVDSEAIGALVVAHRDAGAGATILTTHLDEPAGYGRVVRAADGTVERVVETKHEGDATADELAITEVNAGIYCFDGPALLDALPRIGTDNQQGERYLPDALALIRAAGGAVTAHVADDPAVVLGINDRVQLAEVSALAQRRIQRTHQHAGVTIVDPGSTHIEAGVMIGADTVLEPGTYLRGATAIGAGATIGPHSTLIDTTVGDGSTLVHAYATGATVHAGVSVGPFAYLRPGTVLRDGSKVGTFVEVKNSDIGAGTKVPHLSYLGDADVGEGSNLGAATITANYDGRSKHRTTIGNGVRIAVDTTLVAPVTVGDGAYTAANSAITKDVPPGALGIARPRQENIEGYAARKEADR